ncbi:unnamed protein product [Camellia sinensis]
MTNTMNGVRVKTWPASSSGVASDLHFEDLVMNNVSTPVLIDQQYYPYDQCQPEDHQCELQRYPGNICNRACSRGSPCQDVKMSGICDTMVKMDLLLNVLMTSPLSPAKIPPCLRCPGSPI